MGVSTRCSYGVPILIYRLSTVYVPYIYRISTVVDSRLIAEEGYNLGLGSDHAMLSDW